MAPLGEKAVTVGEDNATQIRGKKRKPGNGKGKGRQGSDDEDEAEGTDKGEDDEDDEDESGRSKDKSSGVLARTGPVSFAFTLSRMNLGPGADALSVKVESGQVR